jgi:putative acetyltransferase
MPAGLRAVETTDHAAIRQIIDAAFEPEDVVAFLDAMWAERCMIGEWLAEDCTGALAYIAFSRVWVAQADDARLPAAMLTPLGVRPDRQRQGIGARLTTHALQALDASGESLFFVLGHPSYYPRFGFRPVPASSVESPWVGKAAFMLRANFVPQGRLVLPAAIANAH